MTPGGGGGELALSAEAAGDLDIARIVEETLEQADIVPVTNLETIMACDEAARAFAEQKIEKTP